MVFGLVFLGSFRVFLIMKFVLFGIGFVGFFVQHGFYFDIECLLLLLKV